jgi:outer membrane protein assembly factor BamA
MKLYVLAALIAAPLVLGNETDTPPQDGNVNSRYKVESVELAKTIDKRISRGLRDKIDGLVGSNFDPQLVSDLATRIRKEVHVVVSHRVERGLQPEHVKVVYEAKERRWDEKDAEVTKLAYHQKQGWTGGLEIGFDAGRNRFEFGYQSDADRLIERYTGFNAGYARRFGEHVRLNLEFDTFHQQWDPATQVALLSHPEVPGIYRERYSIDPSLTFLITPELSLTAGVSFQHFQTQFPAARFQAANAVATTLRHRRRWQPGNSTAGHELDAGYSLRAATRSLDSDFVYARHAVDASYSVRYGRHLILVRAGAGTISGTAPLYERFAIGDTRTLRGWNKFDIDPLGGSRVAHGSAGYRYRAIGVFYDAGAVWDHKEDAEAKHSVGVTVASGALHDGPYLTVAFPLRGGTFTPMFMVGMNF